MLALAHDCTFLVPVAGDMASHYYVYYRIQQPVPAEAKTQIAALLDDIAARTGVRGRLLRKCDDGLTWMEVYEGVTDCHAFETLLSNAAADTEMAQFIIGTRHVECFED